MTPYRLLANLVFAVAMLFAVAACVIAVNSFAAPHRKILPPENAMPPDYGKIATAVDEKAVQREAEAIAACGPRFCGSAGAAKAAAYLAQRLRDLGFEVIEQPFLVTVPVTRYARIADENGRPLAGVKIHPLLPNGVRTCTTPPGGIKGKVFKGEKGLAREFAQEDMRGQIALLPVGAPWHVVAGMGAQAVLYFDQEDAEHSSLWDHSVYASLNIPRFFVEGDVARLVGRTVCIEARVDWEEREVINIIGFLSPPAPASEAVALSAHYDAYAYVPDLAFGARQACSAAVLSAAAGYLAGEKSALKRHLIIAYTAGHAQAHAGARELLRALDRGKEGEAIAEAQAEQKALAERLRLLEEAAAIAADTRYWEAAEEADDNYWQSRALAVRQIFEALAREVLDGDWLEALEAMTQARLAWIREGQPVHRRLPDGRDEIAPSFAAYEAARQRQDFYKSLLAVPWRTLKAKGKFREEILRREIPQRTQALIAQRAESSRQALRRAEARLALAQRFAAVGAIKALNLDLDGWSGRLALVCGEPALAGAAIPADVEYINQFQRAAEALDAIQPGHSRTPAEQSRLVNLIRSGDRTSLNFANTWDRVPFYFESVIWLQSGRCAFTLTDLGDPRREVSTPRERFERLFAPTAGKEGEETAWRRLAVVSRLLTAAAAQMARGMSKMATVTVKPYLLPIRGRVVSQLGDSLVPNHPMPGALVRCHLPNDAGGPLQRHPGVSTDLLLRADEEGLFVIPSVWPQLVSREWGNIVELDAALVRDETGEIVWALSQMCERGQSYNTRHVPLANYERTIASCVLFRAAAVQVFPMPDPNTLQPYPAFEAIEKRGLTAPRDLKTESGAGGTVLLVPPDSHLYFLFKKGRKENPALLDICAFALAAPAEDKAPPAGKGIEAEIRGDGYLAADHPSIVNIEFDVAHSMVQVNSRRLALQQRYGMADEMMARFHRRAAEAADNCRALAASGKMVAAMREAAVSVAYSANIHPVIRKNAFDAICGILFYLFLAIPFVIFMEKLLIGHPDIRGQIAGMAAIFLLFFLALWATHPAFHLVRSTVMILLGFLTFALAASVGVFVSARFSRSIGEIHRRARQEIVTADVSRASAAATAFVLGLNNLRKRPLRTGLTVTTLILITFVMICFTSFRADIADIEFAVGRASYTGLLLRHRM
ncbi:MAG: hypothetical protein N3A66_01525, partial [Planctomycetota bacterium]|nr:hypothetical protein [Planctomycetota bacterium]